MNGNDRRRLLAIERGEQYERPQLDKSWMLEAACRGSSPEMWFPSPGDSKTAKAARAICDGCPVRSECLEYALEANEERGTWGGMGENERQRLRAARRRTRSAS